MRSYKTAIIAVVVLVIAVIGFVIGKDHVQNLNKVEPTKAPEVTEEYLFLFNSADVNKIVTEGSESFTLELNSEERWVCKVPAQVTASSSAIANIVTLMTGATGEVLHKEGEYTGELKDFGLDTPWRFTMYFTDGSKVTYLVGDMNHSGTKYYLMIEGSDKIYTVNTSYGEKLCLTQYSVTEGDLLIFPDITKMATIELYKKGELFYRLEADFAGDSESDKLWNIVEPIEIMGNSANVEAFIETVDSLIISDTVEQSSQNLADYGLDNPSFKYIFKDNKSTYTICLGNKTSDGNYYYCTVNEGTDVFRVYVENLQFIDNPVLSYAYTYAFFENYTGLKSIDIELMGSVNETHKLEFKFGEDESEQILFDGISADKVDSAGNKIYDYLYEVKGITTYCYALQVDKIDAEMSLPKGDLLCRITYNRKDGTSCVVEAYERDNATCYLFVDGKYMGGYCDTWRIFSEENHQGIAGTIKTYEELISKAGLQ